MDEARRTRRLTPARLEAFSDGVLAVIITIMVLELKVPHGSGLAGLQEIVPILLVYLLSFSFVGIYWVNHHMLLSRLEEVDPRTLYTNLLFLFCTSLLPFFTAWLVERERSSFSVLLYTLLLIAVGLSFLFLRLSVQRRLRFAKSLAASDLSEQRKHWVSLAFYVAALGLSYQLPALALACDAVVTLVWILPDLGTRHATHLHERNELDPHPLPSERPSKGLL